MKDYEVLNIINKTGVCAIVRGLSADSLCRTAEALIKGGIKAIEVTFNTPGSAEMIKELSSKYSKDMVIGAGTVLDSKTARIAIMSGASFVLSPSLNLDVVRVCQRYSIVPVPGVLTPTEIITAWENGVQIVKLFPAGAIGPRYIKEIKGPFSHIDIMAVGGIDLTNISDFIKAGACSTGIGSSLVDKSLVEEGKFEELTNRAKGYITAVNEARSIKRIN